jgi:hypothetical protein
MKNVSMRLALVTINGCAMLVYVPTRADGKAKITLAQWASLAAQAGVPQGACVRRS